MAVNKIVLVHPIKHHAYSVMRGIVKVSDKSIALLGYYYRNDFVDRILSKTQKGEKVKGYEDAEINKYVKTNSVIKLFHLLYRAKPKVFKNIFLGIFQLWSIANMKDCDCIYVLNNYCNLVIRYAKKKGMKIIYDQIIAFNYKAYYEVENFSKKSYSFDKNQKKEIWNLLNSDLIIAPSQFVVDSLNGYYFSEDIKDKIKLLPYGGDASEYRYKKRNRGTHEPLKILFVGSASKRKGLCYLMEAVSMYSSSEVVLTVVGALFDDYSQNLLKEFCDSDSIKYVGTVPHAEMVDIYRENHIFCLPSLAEGSSLSTFEALASGMPCIVTTNAGSTICDGVEGFIVRERSSDDIRTCINRFLEDDNLLAKMSENTQSNVKRYSRQNFENGIQEILMNL